MFHKNLRITYEIDDKNPSFSLVQIKLTWTLIWTYVLIKDLFPKIGRLIEPRVLIGCFWYY